MPWTTRLALRAGALLLLTAGVLAGCGDSSDPEPAGLRITAPADTAVVREDSVLVEGRVRPAGAQVVVAGHEADVVGRRFSARVPLDEGSNVIDVGASARGVSSTWTAIRVGRRIVIKVPDVVGDSRDDAVNEIEGLGLRTEVKQDDSFLDRFLPSGYNVCETQPEAGTELAKRALVRLTVSKSC